ncbi:hypothetical protein EDD18DRAFT_1344383 [Armillaria luteobubalina]|uniref:Uncharacterized protein n=1 Tax=Armillaria luteobubalina TaxID=153913 RepID=A0AA39QMA1_9AGAR|nr:hypothetical protein EDD18DRAFT_1344383 [Armillaria luteobubalina]
MRPSQESAIIVTNHGFQLDPRSVFIPVEIVFLILDNADPLGVVQFRMISFGAHKIVMKFMHDTYNTVTLIKRFFPSELAAEFQVLQQQTSLVVSGSSVLTFFYQSSFPDSDCDLYVHSHHCDQVIVFVLKAGYRLYHLMTSQNIESVFHTSKVSFYFCSNNYTLKTITGVHESVHHADENLKVQVILCQESPVDVLLGFHSTVPMNIITHDYAIYLYPKATFNLGVNFAKFDVHVPAVVGRHKYTSHGWTLIPNSKGQQDADLQDVQRYIGDWYCWMIHLPALSPLPQSSSRILDHSWVLSYPKANAGYVTQYRLLSLSTLSQAVCASSAVVEHWQDGMVKWYVFY